MLFKLGDEFYFLPFCLNGSIDVYGKYQGVSPMPFFGSTSTENKDKRFEWLTSLVFKPLYDIAMPDDYIKEDGTLNKEAIENIIEHGCVIVSDYTPQSSQSIIPRQVLNDPLLDVMADMIPYLRTSLSNSTGIVGVRVGGQDEFENVENFNRSVQVASLTGKKMLPVVGTIDFQQLTNGAGSAQSEEFLQTFQSLDNYRLSLYGLKSNGVYTKKAHLLEEEQAMNSNNVGLIMNDCLENRHLACDIANSIWGLGIWCEPSEAVMNQDIDGNGIVGSEPEKTVNIEETNDTQEAGQDE